MRQLQISLLYWWARLAGSSSSPGGMLPHLQGHFYSPTVSSAKTQPPALWPWARHSPHTAVLFLVNHSLLHIPPDASLHLFLPVALALACRPSCQLGRPLLVACHRPQLWLLSALFQCQVPWNTLESVSMLFFPSGAGHSHVQNPGSTFIHPTAVICFIFIMFRFY